MASTIRLHTCYVPSTIRHCCTKLPSTLSYSFSYPGLGFSCSWIHTHICTYSYVYIMSFVCIYNVNFPNTHYILLKFVKNVKFFPEKWGSGLCKSANVCCKERVNFPSKWKGPRNAFKPKTKANLVRESFNPWGVCSKSFSEKQLIEGDYWKDCF